MRSLVTGARWVVRSNLARELSAGRVFLLHHHVTCNAVRWLSIGRVLAIHVIRVVIGEAPDFYLQREARHVLGAKRPHKKETLTTEHPDQLL